MDTRRAGARPDIGSATRRSVILLRATAGCWPLDTWGDAPSHGGAVGFRRLPEGNSMEYLVGLASRGSLTSRNTVPCAGPYGDARRVAFSPREAVADRGRTS